MHQDTCSQDSCVHIEASGTAWLATDVPVAERFEPDMYVGPEPRSEQSIPKSGRKAWVSTAPDDHALWVRYPIVAFSIKPWASGLVLVMVGSVSRPSDIT
jgi:hypothetical protein